MRDDLGVVALGHRRKLKGRIELWLREGPPQGSSSNDDDIRMRSAEQPRVETPPKDDEPHEAAAAGPQGSRASQDAPSAPAAADAPSAAAATAAAPAAATAVAPAAPAAASAVAPASQAQAAAPDPPVLTFEEARAIVWSLKLPRGKHPYLAFSEALGQEAPALKAHLGIFNEPIRFYGNKGWKGWEDFVFGYAQPQQGNQAQAAAATPAPPVPGQSAQAQSIEIFFHREAEESVMVKVRPTAKLGFIFEAVCSRISVARAAVRFVLNGDSVSGGDTPSDVGLKDGDVIEMIESGSRRDGPSAPAVATVAPSSQAPAAQRAVPAVSTAPPVPGQSVQATQSAQPRSIGIIFKTMDRQEITVRAHLNTKLERMFHAVCARLNVERGSMRFLFDGWPVSGMETPAHHEMEDGDCIDVIQEQCGGKPVILLYPESDTQCTVSLELSPKWALSCVYPKPKGYKGNGSFSASWYVCAIVPACLWLRITILPLPAPPRLPPFLRPWDIGS